MAGEPVAVVCGPDGIRRAFSNVCRHRGARVVCEPEGKATRLRCHYHGWTYDLAGRLRGTPEFEGVAEFQREEQGLPPLAVDVWGPLVFVHLGKPVPALADFLARCPNWNCRGSWSDASTSWRVTGRCSSITTWTAAIT